MSRVVAFDYGEARCGAAVSDPTGTLARPLEAIERPGTRRGLERAARLVRNERAERVVVGLPLTLEGNEGEQAAVTREWAARLGEVVSVPVELHDERLTTRQAEQAGGRADADSRAAAHLLESWLSSQSDRTRA